CSRPDSAVCRLIASVSIERASALSTSDLKSLAFNQFSAYFKLAAKVAINAARGLLEGVDLLSVCPPVGLSPDDGPSAGAAANSSVRAVRPSAVANRKNANHRFLG